MFEPETPRTYIHTPSSLNIVLKKKIRKILRKSWNLCELKKRNFKRSTFRIKNNKFELKVKTIVNVIIWTGDRKQKMANKEVLGREMKLER